MTGLAVVNCRSLQISFPQFDKSSEGVEHLWLQVRQDPHNIRGEPLPFVRKVKQLDHKLEIYMGSVALEALKGGLNPSFLNQRYGLWRHLENSGDIDLPELRSLPRGFEPLPKLLVVYRHA